MWNKKERNKILIYTFFYALFWIDSFDLSGLFSVHKRMQHVSLFIRDFELKWNFGLQYLEPVAWSDAQQQQRSAMAAISMGFLTHVQSFIQLWECEKYTHNRMPSIWNVNANRHFRCYECKRKKMWCEMWKCHYCRMQRESELCILPINYSSQFEIVRYGKKCAKIHWFMCTF